MRNMVNRFKGSFSASFNSLKLQLASLLEEAGGDHALSLMDSLANLSRTEQEIVLGVFNRVCGRIAEGERLLSDTDKELKAFEENLYQDVIKGMCAFKEGQASNKLEVLKGGKTKRTSTSPIDLESARRNRKSEKPVLN